MGENNIPGENQTFRLPRADWHLALASSIKKARPGDTVVVHTEAMKELAGKALERMRPGEKINFVIEEEQTT